MEEESRSEVSSVEFNHLEVKQEVEVESGHSSGRATPQAVSRLDVTAVEHPLGLSDSRELEEFYHLDSADASVSVGEGESSFDAAPERLSSSGSLLAPVSDELQTILEDPHTCQLFLNYLNEWHVDMDLLFVMQVDQLQEIAQDASPQVLKEQFQRIYHKHIGEKAELPLTQLPQRSLKTIRKQLESGQASLADFQLVQLKIKASLDKNFVHKFLKEHDFSSSDLVGQSAYIPTLNQVVDDLECLQLFVLYLMKDSRHRMFLFWLELQEIAPLLEEFQNSASEVEEEKHSAEFDQLEHVYRKYLSMGMMGTSLPDEREGSTRTSNLSEASSVDLLEEKGFAGCFVFLCQRLAEMNRKVGRVLRLELWPEFCKSDLFQNLLNARRDKKKHELDASVPKSRRYSLVSLYKSHILSDDIVITVPKHASFFPSSSAQPSKLLEYVVVVEAKYQDNRFEAKVIKSYPETSRPGCRLPPHIEMFCFPERCGGSLSSQAPSPPRLFNFSLSLDGHRLYCACLQLSAPSSHALLAVCVISRVPLLQVLREQLLPLASASAPLWESASFQSLLESLDAPSPSPSILASLPRYSLHPLQRSLQTPDFSVSHLFTILHPYKVLAIVEYLLMEKKVLLVSSQLSLLALAGEALRTLLFPFEFQFLYTPVLPRALLSALQCPTPFLIGIHSSLRDQALAMEHIQQDLFVVDLDYDSVSPALVVETPFPSKVRTKLLRYFRKASFGPLVDLDFSHVPRPPSVWSKKVVLEETSCPVTNLRKALYHAWMGDLLEGLQNFVVVIPDTREDRPPLLLLDAPAFCRSKPPEYLAFLRAFFQTGAFSAFLGTIVAQTPVHRLSILGDYGDA